MEKTLKKWADVGIRVTMKTEGVGRMFDCVYTLHHPTGSLPGGRPAVGWDAAKKVGDTWYQELMPAIMCTVELLDDRYAESRFVRRFARGENFDETTSYSVGSRAGQYDGWETRGNELVAYLPARYVDGTPQGTQTVIVATRIML